ncbi:uncharacterized protein RAG0_07094 [Rhynchosporium agropyri]|uniref:Uncharacterized protein n=1 Tax=Rhynchosporium agropyri TaxID=914238 RepID=A0A1E1KK05_9HELO|nr:uncharacterized protein RAG0_07094 [Rhynchosporium agropyri]
MTAVGNMVNSATDNIITRFDFLITVRACLRMHAPREYKKRLFRIEDSLGPKVENLERLP